jgi:hypothetical protein
MPARSQGVMAGLDPVIHPSRWPVDARVKSGHDGGGSAVVAGAA